MSMLGLYRLYLWNVAYTSLPRINIPDGTIPMDYKEDDAIQITAPVLEVGQLKINEIMWLVNKWTKEHRLTLKIQNRSRNTHQE